MRKTLLATSALACAGALAVGSASAADMMSVGVSGYMEQWIGMTSLDGAADEGGVSQWSDSEFNVTGKLEADNGLTFSVKIEVEGNTSSDQIDESQATVSGSFGQVVLGSEDHPASIMHYGNQDVGVGLSCGDPNWIAGVTSCAREGEKGLGTSGWLIGGDDQKIAYYTPRMAGVQFGAAYIPNASGGTGVSEDKNIAPTNNDEDAWSVGLNYMGDMGGSSVALSFGHYQESQVGAPISYVTGAAPGAGATDTRLSQLQHDDHMTAVTAYEGGRDLMTVGEAKMVKAGDQAAAIVAKNAIYNASAMMTKADAQTFSNFGLQVGFGAFSFDVAYAAHDGGAYKVVDMPVKMSAAEITARGGSNGMVIDPSNEGDFTDDGVDNKGPESATNNDPRNETWMVQRIAKNTSLDYEVASAGVNYTDGPMAVSLSHMMAEADDGSESNATMLSFRYGLAPGIASRTSLIAGEQDGVQGTAFVTGIKIGF